jgi:FMS-like tyrosine kinase 1
MVSVSVVLGLTLIIFFLGFKMRKDRIIQNTLYKADFIHFENGAIQRINPDLGIDEQAVLLPYEQTWEFPRDKLKMGKSK